MTKILQLHLLAEGWQGSGRTWLRQASPHEQLKGLCSASVATMSSSLRHGWTLPYNLLECLTHRTAAGIISYKTLKTQHLLYEMTGLSHLNQHLKITPDLSWVLCSIYPCYNGPASKVSPPNHIMEWSLRNVSPDAFTRFVLLIFVPPTQMTLWIFGKIVLSFYITPIWTRRGWVLNVQK